MCICLLFHAIVRNAIYPINCWLPHVVRCVLFMALEIKLSNARRVSTVEMPMRRSLNTELLGCISFTCVFRGSVCFVIRKHSLRVFSAHTIHRTAKINLFASSCQRFAKEIIVSRERDQPAARV